MAKTWLCPVKAYINRQWAVGYNLSISVLSNRKVPEVCKDKHDCVSTKLYLWALQFEFHIIFKGHKNTILPFIFFQPFNDIKIVIW